MYCILTLFLCVLHSQLKIKCCVSYVLKYGLFSQTAVFELVNGERVEDRLCVDFDDVVEEHIITDSKHPMLPLKASRKYCFTNLCNSKLNVPVTDACSFYTPYSGVCRAISTWTTFLLPSLIILFTEPGKNNALFL
ncbi:unnamed protein product [Calicophoron daubneyi]|uniref:Uncharacterized protein n=1 Tax=Calicophoron daubneyi TaxID=300641 RepID=A0AAV2TTG7_CALDB